MIQVYAELLDSGDGYNIMVVDGDNPAQLALTQPEPHIVYRVTNEDGTTDYQASGDLHAKKFLEELIEQQESEEEKQTLEERMNEHELNQAETELVIDERLCNIELGLN